MTPEEIRAQLIREALELDEFGVAGDQAASLKAMIHKEMNQCRNALEEDFNKVVDDHTKEEAARYKQIVEQLTEVQKQLKDIHDLFTHGRGVLLALKWGAIIASGAWALLIWGRDHLKL